MAVACSHAIRTGIPTADNHNMLALGADRIGFATGFATIHLLVLWDEKLEGRIGTLQFTPGYRQITRHFRTRRQNDRVKFLLDLLSRNKLSGIAGNSPWQFLASDHHSGTETDT